MDPVEVMKRAREKYTKSEKGKNNQKKYETSELGRSTRKRYFKSEKGKLALIRYQMSEKGRKAKERQEEKIKFLRACNKWICENPGKTIVDYLNFLKEVSSVQKTF